MRSDSELEPPHLEPISSVHQMALNHGSYPNPLESALQLKQEVVHKNCIVGKILEVQCGESLWPHSEKNTNPCIVDFMDYHHACFLLI